MENLFSQGIDRESIEYVKQQLQSGGVPQNKIDTIIKTLEDQISDSVPEELVEPNQPEEPDTSPATTFNEQPNDLNKVKDVLKPGKYISNKKPLRVCAYDAIQLDNEIEDLVEDFMNSGIDPDSARKAAEKIILGEEIMPIAQRERKGPAKEVVTFHDTLYDRIISVAEELELNTPNKAEPGSYYDVETTLNNISDEIRSLQDQIQNLSTILGNIKNNHEGDDADFVQADEILGQLEDSILEASSAVDAVELPEESEEVDLTDFANDLYALAEEVKLVGLDTQAGTTNPIDLGDWLY